MFGFYNNIYYLHIGNYPDFTSGTEIYTYFKQVNKYKTMYQYIIYIYLYPKITIQLPKHEIGKEYNKQSDPNSDLPLWPQ